MKCWASEEASECYVIPNIRYDPDQLGSYNSKAGMGPGSKQTMKLTIRQLISLAVFCYLASLSSIALASSGRLTVYFASAGPGAGDGYENASADISYVVLNCQGDITIAVSLIRGAVSASDGYWFEGKRIQGGNAPNDVYPHVSGTVYSGGKTIGSFSLGSVGISPGMGCFSASHSAIVGRVSDFLGADATIQERQAFMQAMHVKLDKSSKTLRNGSLETTEKDRIRKVEQEALNQQRLEEHKKRLEQEEAQRKAQEAAASTPTGDETSEQETDEWGMPIAPPVTQLPAQGATPPQPDPYAQMLAREQRRQQNLEAKQQAIDNVSNLVETSFYAWQAARGIRNNLDNLAMLKGDYSSVEQLEADFRRQSGEIDSQFEELDRTSRENTERVTEMLFQGSEADQAVGKLVGGLSNMMAQADREKERREMQAKLERQREARRKEIEEKKFAALVAIRKKVFSGFPEGGVPLSSDDIPVDSLYFFSYTANQAEINQKNPAITVSNIFPVYRQGSGGWPFTFAIKRELQSIQPGNNTLIGFYTKRDDAEKVRASLLKLAKTGNFSIRNMTYNGPSEKPVITSAEDAALWGLSGAQVSDDNPWGESGSGPDSAGGNRTGGKAGSGEDFW